MRISDLPKVIIISLIITLIIECTLGYILGYRTKDLLNIFLVNILTNPIFNAILISINYYYGLKYRNISLTIFELIIFIVEGFIYYKYLERRKINPYLLSFILNFSSYFLGKIINNIIY